MAGTGWRGAACFGFGGGRSSLGNGKVGNAHPSRRRGGAWRLPRTIAVGVALAAALGWTVPASAQAVGFGAPAIDPFTFTDTVAPTVAFGPNDGTLTNEASRNISVTFSERVYGDAQNTAFTDETAKSLLTLKRDNASGADIPFAASVVLRGDAAHRRMYLKPSSSLTDGKVYVAVGNGYYDASGNQGGADNATFTIDTTAPTVSSAAVTGDRLTITFSETMNASSTPAASAFTVDVSGTDSDPTVSSYTLAGRKAVLTLSAAVAQSASVTLGYTGSGAAVLKDLAGNRMAPVSGQSVENRTGGNDLTVSASVLPVTEGGTGSFTVQLAKQPTGNVTVDLASNNTDVTLSDASLGFTTSNWNDARTVTVTAAQDDDAGDDTATLTLNPRGGGYDSVPDATVAVTVDDDDQAGYRLSGSALSGTTLTITEGASANLDLRLATQPTGDVTVTLTSDSTEVTLSSGSLSFTSTTWNTNQTVTVTATGDDDASDDTATVTLSAWGGDYHGVTDATVTVSVNDDDTEGLTLAPSALTVTEGASGTFTVQLATLPSGDVTVGLSSDNGDVTLSDASLSFGTGTWNVAQTVTVTVAEDADLMHESANVTLNPSGGGYDGVATDTLVVSVRDNDDVTAPAVTFMPAAGSVIRDAYANIWLTFDESTYADGSGTPFTNDTAAALVTLTRTTADGEAIPFTARAHLTGETAHRRITITPTSKPLPDGVIHVALGTGYYDGAGNQGAAVSATFAVDTVGPTVMGFSPADGATTSEIYGGITIGFDDLVYQANGKALDDATAAGLVTLRRFGVSGTDISFTASAVVSGDAAHRRIYVKPDQALPEGDVYVGVGDAYYDAVGNQGTAASATFTVSTTAGQPALSVADASVHEGPSAELAFIVSLDRAVVDRDGTVSVQYATRDVTADAGLDYTAASGTLTFAVGEQRKTVNVAVLEDAHDDDGETLDLVLSNAVGATIADGTGRGTIHNTDSLPMAWLGRLGRTVAEQVIEGVSERREALRTPGERVGTFGGQSIGGQMLNEESAGGFGESPWAAALRGEDAGPFGPVSPRPFNRFNPYGQPDWRTFAGDGLGGIQGPFGWHGQFGGAHASGMASDMGGGDMAGLDPYGGSMGGMMAPRTTIGRELLLGASFGMTGKEDEAGGTLGGWGRMAESSFGGVEGGTNLDGRVTTGLLGVDYAREGWMAGVVLSRTSADGGYKDAVAGSGFLESSLTAATAYGSLAATDKIELWGAAGHGRGEVALTLEDGPGARADLGWTMAAAGARGALLERGGLTLALVSDAMWARTASDDAHTGSLLGAEADVTRLRFGVEGSWAVSMARLGELTPTLEFGARHDGGDAETGLGMEVGGGLAWSIPALGLTLDVSGRTLLAHQDDDYEDMGFSAGLVFAPGRGSGTGPSLTLRHDLGGASSGGLEALFATEGPSRYAGGTMGDGMGGLGTGWTAEAEWGMPVLGKRYLGTPLVGHTRYDASRDYSVGWRLAPVAEDARNITLGVLLTRSEALEMLPDHRIEFGFDIRW